MRILLAGAAAALFSFAAATPAFAQFGGSPQQQVDGAPNQRVQGQDQAGDEDDQAVAPEDDGAYGKPGAYGDVSGAYPEPDETDDQGFVGNEVDRGDADNDVDQADADEDADQAELSDGGVAGGGYASQQQTWRGEDGQSYCRRSDGTTGLVVGGGAGALVGRGIDGGRHRSGGTIIGAIAGAIIGSAIEQSANRQRCQ